VVKHLSSYASAGSLRSYCLNSGTTFTEKTISPNRQMAFRIGVAIAMAFAGTSMAKADARGEAASMELGLRSCIQQAGSEVEQHSCVELYLENIDRLLNLVYQRTLAEKKEKWVRQAQRAWIPFRDAHCSMEASDYEGGTYETHMYNQCLFYITKQRVEALSAFMAE
jgi:uncharacterized protein YecT (DUF1311 family)